MNKVIVVFAVMFSLTGCSGYFGSGSSDVAVLTTTGISKPVFVPGRADKDLFEVSREIDAAEQSIDKGKDSGALTRGEARDLNAQASSLNRTAEFFAQDGMPDSMKRSLENQARILDEQAKMAPPKPERMRN